MLIIVNRPMLRFKFKRASRIHRMREALRGTSAFELGDPFLEPVRLFATVDDLASHGVEQRGHELAVDISPKEDVLQTFPVLGNAALGACEQGGNVGHLEAGTFQAGCGQVQVLFVTDLVFGASRHAIALAPHEVAGRSLAGFEHLEGGLPLHLALCEVREATEFASAVVGLAPFLGRVGRAWRRGWLRRRCLGGSRRR